MVNFDNNSIFAKMSVKEIKIGCAVGFKLGDHWTYDDKCPICSYNNSDYNKRLEQDPGFSYGISSIKGKVIMFQPENGPWTESENQISCADILQNGDHRKYDKNCFLCRKYGNLSKKDIDYQQ